MTREEIERIADVAFKIFTRDGRRVKPDKLQIYFEFTRATVGWFAARSPTAEPSHIWRETIFELVRNAPLPRSAKRASYGPQLTGHRAGRVV